MMRWLGRWLKRALLAALLLVLLLLSPVAYVELACKGEPVASDYDALLPPEHHRPEARTILTYPEWHIVHAYDDYAKVIEDGDPHEFGYAQAVTGFWSSLCSLSEASATHGGFPSETKLMIYTIGVSFTAELGLKALYEETVGRFFAWLRGPQRSPLDDLSAHQAAEYAAFLQQVPWYKWDFAADAAALKVASSGTLRDRERSFALGLEFGAKARYAKVIAQAVTGIGADQLTLRMIVTGLTPEELTGFEGVKIIAERPVGIEIETPRYRVLTHLLADMAAKGAEFLEIAGNDDIMLTAISPDNTDLGGIFSFPRQGYGDTRHLIMVKVPDLAETLRSFANGPVRLEHVHDY